MKNQIIENRRDFVKRLLIGAAAAGIISQLSAQGETAPANKAVTVDDVRAVAQQVRDRYQNGTEEYRQAVIEKLFDDYRNADDDAMRRIYLNFGAFIIH